MERLRGRNFLEEKLSRVGKMLQELKESQRIKDFRGPSSFTKRMGVNFYFTYIDGKKYVPRSLSIVRTPGKGQNKNSIRASLFDSLGSIRWKVLESIRRL